MAIYRVKRFSKNPEEVTVRIGTFYNKSRLGDLTDEQLKNISNWNNLTDKQKKNVKKNNISLVGTSALIGSAIGYSKSFRIKKGLKGAAIGGGLGTGFVLAVNKRHKKQADAAEKLLKNKKK